MAGTEKKIIPKVSIDMKLQKTNLRLARKGSKESFCLEQVIIFLGFYPTLYESTCTHFSLDHKSFIHY